MATEETKEVEKPTAKFLYYPSIESGGTKEKKGGFKGSNKGWSIQEKIDGSQFSFNTDGTTVRFFCGKRERFLATEDANSLFSKAMAIVNTKIKLLKVGLTYHAEVIQDLRHSTCTYAKLPRGFMLLYDVQDENGNWFVAKDMQAEATRIEIESVRILHDNADENINPFEKAAELMQQISEGKLESQLGGKVEGIVIKHPAYFKTPTSKPTAMKIKIVAKEFKEKHAQKKVRADRISPTDYIAWIGAHYDTAARVTKARQHLHTQHDIANPTIEQLCAELDADLLKERRIEIETYLWSHFRRYVISMLANNGELKGVALERFNDDPIVAQIKQCIDIPKDEKTELKDETSATVLSAKDANITSIKAATAKATEHADQWRQKIIDLLIPKVCTMARKCLQ